MSYSFGVKAANKVEAYNACVVKMDEVVTQQACHAKDRDQALANVRAALDLLPEVADKDVAVSMNGYLSGTWSGNDVTEVTGVNISASAGLVARTA
jgi:predicted RNase H-like HicB family nuclease